MAKRSVRSAKRVISPIFFIPDGVEDFVYEDDTETGQTLDFDVIFDDVDFADGPPVPVILGVFEQVVRILPDGSQVVDVTIEVEDIEGAEFELRVAKVVT